MSPSSIHKSEREAVEGKGVAPSCNPRADSSARLAETAPDDIVGHKTFSDGPGRFRHEPLTRAEADEMLAAIDARKKQMAEAMPDDRAALNAMHAGYYRLTQLGWSDGIYCPKDGSPFEVCQAGSTGIFRATYSGEWPNGYLMVEDGGDLWPTRPEGHLWRPISETEP